MWDKFKEAMRKYPWLWAVLGIAVAGVIWLIWRWKGGQNGQEVIPTVTTAVTPEVAGTGGGEGGGYPVDNTAALAALLESFGSSQTQALQEMAAGQQAGIKALLETIGKSQEETLSQIGRQQQTVRQQQEEVVQQTAQTKQQQLPEFYYAPVTSGKSVGGTGGGFFVTESMGQLNELLRGGSKNVGGSYFMDFGGWQPATSGVGSESWAREKVSVVTGKSGTVEQQLAGMSAREKLAAITKAGLGN